MAEKKQPDVLLKFKAEMPVHLRTAMVEFGFTYYAAKHGEWVIFAKHNHAPKSPVQMDKELWDKSRETLGAPWETELERKMNKIVDAYLDPYSHLGAIKAQIIHMSKTLPLEQEKWCMDWMEKNIDSEFFTPPWEDPNYEPNLGSC